MIINIRGYHYVASSKYYHTFKVPQFTDRIAFFDLPLYEQYLNFKYFPPIYIKSFGDSNW